MSVRKVAFTAYPAKDFARVRKFYEEVMGLAVGMKGTFGDMFWLEYDLPEGGCIAFSNALQREPSTGAGGLIALEVADLDGMIAKLKAAGVEFLGEIVPGPKCRMQTIRDSEGNGVLLHQLNHKH